MLSLSEIEAALAEEAAAHARAALELNPFGEAEAVDLGSARLVYSGTISPVHGVYALGLDGPPEDRDWEDIRRFFQKKEREPNFFITPFTDPSVEDRIAKSHRLARTERISGWVNLGESETLHEAYVKGPDHKEWCLAFTRQRNPAAQEPDLLAAIKLHQKNTRFYLQGGEASYTFFYKGIALVPHPAPALFEIQKKEAEAFRSAAFVAIGASQSTGTGAGTSTHRGDNSPPLLFERKVYEPV